MAALLYLFRGLTLIWYFISPTYRRKTNTRWQRMRPHQLVFEVGVGIIGLMILAAFSWLMFDRLLN
jgi:hypothetical protein